MMKNIKVLHIVHDFLKGGIESFLYYLAKEQTKNQRLQIGILCLQNEKDISNPRITNLGVKIFYVRINPFEVNIFKYLEIIKITNKYNLIHVHTYKPILNSILNLSKAGKIVTIHSAGIIYRSLTLKFRLKNILYKNYLSNKKLSLAFNSNYTREFWKEQGIQIRKGKVIYNGVYFNTKFNEENCYLEYPELKDKFIIGTTSRLIAWKRVDFLICAFAEMAKKTTNAILLIIGDGSEKNKLIALCNKLGITEQVIFTGYKSNITDYQSLIDICVFPSVSEPFGLVAVECLNLGKPVFVMNDGGGITEIIKEVEPNNIAISNKNLVELLDKSIDDSSLFNVTSKNKRIEYSKKFSISQTEHEYFQFYKEILSQNKL